MKIVFFENGHVHDNAIDLIEKKVQKKSITKITKTNLMKYDIVIVPSYSNQDILSKMTKKFKKFVYCGGILILLGASEDKTHWLPFCTHHKPFQHSIKLKNVDTQNSKNFLKNLNLITDTFKFHNGFYSHGYFTCNNEICKPIILGEKEENVVMALLKPKESLGTIFISTLDPDFHSQSGYTRDRLVTNKNAKILFHNIINWACNNTLVQNKFVKTIRYIYGINRYLIITWLIIVFSGIILISIPALILTLINSNTFISIAAISSILSFILALINITIE